MFPPIPGSGPSSLPPALAPRPAHSLSLPKKFFQRHLKNYLSLLLILTALWSLSNSLVLTNVLIRREFEP